ncbi:hypothetical protein [Lysinibacillus halotolerans]|uniref:Uncharacterized protein n=1 Tax=Lysinibacillus halotolerans TaxID=1368476 RepID=A0A3M8H1G4_9BACI|nr:hypothetical protein [Lysinibacillus halotolerans]RNC96271.1 hypothetical protein EC501_17115 [Lysinibacillus halotolerans]
MSIKVVTPFNDKETDHVYRVGDEYPAKGFEASSERIEFLSKPHPETKKVYLFVEEDQSKKDLKSDVDNEGEFPQSTGGGWYLLSNGEKIQGKEEALAAEKALKSGE